MDVIILPPFRRYVFLRPQLSVLHFVCVGLCFFKWAQVVADWNYAGQVFEGTLCNVNNPHLHFMDCLQLGLSKINKSDNITTN